MDGFEYFMRFVLWLCRWTGWLIGAGIQKTYLAIFATTAIAPVKQTTAQLSAEEDRRRLAGCEQVVKHYVMAYGFIARECISREELGQKIDEGISPQALEQEICDRMREYPGIILGTAANTPNEIKLPHSWRQRHIYIVGRSGSGKTNIIKNMIWQSLALGEGIGVLAPELELLTEGILPFIPRHRIDDVVFVNPADTKYPISFNPLYVDEGENISEKVGDLVTIFKRIVGETGSRMDFILRRSLYALMERKGSTLLDIERLLSPFDDSLRKEIIRTTKDDRVISFFTDQFPRLSKDATLPIISRLDEFLHSDIIRSLLCQPGESFDFRTAMDDGRILLFNLSDGLLGVQNARLLGQLIVSKIQLALMSRADTLSGERPPFYLYLDEFQAFVGDNKEAYSTILSRARKYGFGLILAHQQTGQLSPDLLQEILGNVSTMLTFSVSAADAKRLSQEYVFEGKPLPPQEFINLRTGQAIGKIGTNIFPLTTYLADRQPDVQQVKLVIERSRQNYASRGRQRPPENRKPPDRRALDEPPPPDPDEVFE
jgi:hypothetical protein